MNDRSDINNLKAQVNLATLVARSVELKQVGKNLMGRCPFHDDSTASMSVGPKLFNCFGCDAGGDVLKWLQLKEKLDFPAAVVRLQELASQFPVSASEPKRNICPENHQDEMRRVAELYHRALLDSQSAQDYLKSRGLESRELWNTFQIGYADGSLLDLLPSKGPIFEALQACGLVNERGREHFKGCIVVPLDHPEQGVVNFYGRKIGADAVSHLYLPGPKRGVFNRKALQHSSQVLLVESVIDALSLWQSGCKNVTALLGCQLTDDVQAALPKEVVFCLDGDLAGQTALAKLACELASQGKTCFEVELPDDLDPNEVLLKSGSAALKRLVQSPKLCYEPEPGPVGCVDKTEDGFMLRLDDIEYRVTPQPPFQAKLKVLLKASCEGKRYSEVLDLLSSRSSQMSLAAMGRRFKRPKCQLEDHLNQILSEAESWVEAQQAVDEMATQKAPEMTAAEREEALSFLKQPNLVKAILKDMDELGYVGEENSKLLAYLIGLSRKLQNPLSGIVISQAGAGKSGLTELVELLTPGEDVVLFSRLSSQALYYMPKDYLKRKLLILEERVGAEAAEYSIRVLQSRQFLSQAVVVKDPNTGQMSTRRFEVEGPIAYLETTTSHRINHENATRCFELTLDESEMQTQRIHQRQRQSRTLEGLMLDFNTDKIQKKHHNAQRLLEQVKIVIPFVDLLSFPSRWLRTRRDHERFLCLIEAVTFLHQKQRVQNTLASGLVYIEATLEDYQLAFELAQGVLAATFHELSRGARELLDVAVELQESCKEPGLYSFTRREIRQSLDWPDRRVQDAVQELVDMEYLGVLAGSQGKAFRYRILETPEHGSGLLRNLTTPAQLAQLLQTSASFAA